MDGVMSLPRVVIEVSGGVVTDVTASIPIEYLVVDHDNLEHGDVFDPTFQEIEAEPNRVTLFAAGFADGGDGGDDSES